MINPVERSAALRIAAYGYSQGRVQMEIEGEDTPLKLGRGRARDKGKDSLLELADLLDRVWELLCPQANVNRLAFHIEEQRDANGGDPTLLSVEDFKRWVQRFEEFARAAHRGRGRPPKKLDLEFAYNVLVNFG